MADLAQLVVRLTADTEQFRSQMESVGERTQAVGRKMASVGRDLTAFVTLPIAGVGAAAFKMAADAAEAGTKMEAVFGGATQNMNEWITELRDTIPATTAELQGMTSEIGDLLIPLGLAPDAAQAMTKRVVELAGDLASFNNIPMAEALERIRSGLVGQNEPLLKFGVAIDAATVKARALELGLIAEGQELDAAARAQAAFSLILEKTTAAHGDAGDTAGSAANQLKFFWSETKEASVVLGNQLLPILTPFITRLTEIIVRFQNLSPEMQKTIVVIGGIAAAVGPLLVVMGTLVTSAGAVAGALAAIGPVTVAVTASIGLFAAAVLLPIKNMKALLGQTDEMLGRIAESWGEFRDFVVEVFDVIGVDISDFVDWLGGIARDIGDWAVRVTDRFRDAKVGAVGQTRNMQEGIARYWGLMNDQIDTQLAGINASVDEGMADMTSTVGQASVEVVDFWTLMWDSMQAKTVSTKNKVLGELYQMRQEFDATVSGMIDDSLKEFARIEIEAPPIVGRVTTPIDEELLKTKEGMLDRIGDIVDTSAGKFGTLQGRMLAEIDSLPSGLQGVFGRIRDAIQLGQGGFNVATEIQNWIDLAAGIVSAIKSIAGYLSSKRGQDVLGFLGNIATAPGPQLGVNPGGSGSPFGPPPVFVGGGLPSGATIGVGTLHLDAIKDGALLVARRLDQYLDAGGTLNANLVAIRDALRGSVAVLLNDISRLHGASLDRIAAGIDALQMAPAVGPQTQPAAALSSGGSGGIRVTNQFYGDFNGLNEQDISRAVTERTVEEVDRLIGQKTVTDRTFRGVL